MANVCSPTRAVRVIHQLVTLVALCSFAVAASAQTTVTLSTPGAHITVDTTIQDGTSAVTDLSSLPVLASKLKSTNTNRRILIKFDTEKYIPANVTINDAHLYLVLNHAESGESRPLTVFHVAQSFVTGSTNWLYFRPGQAWRSAGGDFDAQFGTTYVGNAVGSAYGWDVTQLVQRSVNGDFGSRYTRLALVDTGAVSSINYKEFHSTRSSSTALRPRLVITYGSAQSAPPPPAPAPPPPAPAPAPAPSPTGTTLRVMQWNVHKTKNSNGVCDPDFTANTIVAQRPDVVSLNEVNSYSGDCAWNFDMGERLRTLVQQKTGVTWYRQSDNPPVSAISNAGDVLLSRYPLVTSSSTLLSFGRGVSHVGIVVNGRTVNLFSTHIEWDVPSWRPTQIKEAIAYLNTFSEPRILMGDFNTAPATSDYYLFATPYQDSWLAAVGSGTASSFNGTGNTIGFSRFDYVLTSKVSSLSLKSVNVPDTRVNGVRPSDHDPVVTVFTVK
jgi:endonuclease/exonuclease/phosphatase family metal-dependent hydrolase